MDTRSIVKSVLSQNGYLPVNRTMIKALGLDEASLLAVLVDGDEMFKDKLIDGWFFCTADTIKGILNIKRCQYESALKTLVDRGLVETKLMSVPAKKHFKLNYNAIFDILNDSQFVENQQTSLPEISKLDCRKPANIYKENNNKDSLPLNPLKGEDLTKSVAWYDKIELEYVAEKHMQAVTEWIQHRRDIRKSYTPRGFRMWYHQMVTECGDNPEVLLQAVRASVANGWQGCFPRTIMRLSGGKIDKSTAEYATKRAQEVLSTINFRDE